VIDRRAFLGLAGVGAVAAPAIAHAQPGAKAHRIGFLSLQPGPGATTEAFRQALRELGYVEGRTITVEYRWAAAKEERLPELAAELVRLKVDVIVASGTPSIEAAKSATSTIPIIMAVVADPVGSGLVSGIGRPGGNVTGLTLLSTELAGKRLQLLRELVPKATRVAVLAYRGTSATRLFLEQMRAAAQQMGVVLVVQEVSEAEGLPAAVAAMQRDGAQALIVQFSTLSNNNAQRIVELAARHRLPAMYDVRGFAELGGLLAYGPSVLELFRRAALYVDRILNGANPDELPLEHPTKFELVVKMKAAKALGVTVPPSLLSRADEIIQ
jgi:putative ABC transport system substrate-binding protein